MNLESGTKLGRYEILSLLGAGGMGEVYLAHDSQLNRKIALKILPSNFTTDRDRLRRFRQEATAAASLNHPSIAHIYELAEVTGIHLIAMEYVEGETLTKKFRESQTDLPKLLRYLQHVAEGLAKAHDAGVVHRDLKPDNILITGDGHVKILDFGLAKLVERSDESSSGLTSNDEAVTILQHSAPGLVLGTTGYMSPEQAQGKTAGIDARSDIFSFGCILFEAVTGRRPFEGRDTIDSLNKIIREPAPPISTFNPNAPADLQRIVRRCLAKDPDDRYQTIKDVAIELKELRSELKDGADYNRKVTATSLEQQTLYNDEGTRIQNVASATDARSIQASTGVSSAEFIVGGIKRHKIATSIVVVMLLLAVGLATAAFVSYRHAVDTETAIDSIAVIPFANEMNDPNTEWISDGLTESVINSLTQLPRLKVIARSSVFRYKGQQRDPIAVGKELGVRAVLTGRLQPRGNSMLISAELVDVRDNKQLWGDIIEHEIPDMLSAQRELAQEITNKLRPTLSGDEQQRLTKQLTVNPEAYQSYLKGRFYWNKRTPPDFKKAIDYFKDAINKDPNYAMAYSGLADSYALLTVYTNESPSVTMPLAKEAALKALALDDKLAEAHASLGQVVLYADYDFKTAEKEYRRAIELNPNYPSAHQWYAEMLSSMKRPDEALNEIRRALELDPLSVIINRIYADILSDARRYDEAIVQYHKTLELDPNFPTAHLFLSRAYQAKGMYDQAIDEYVKSNALGLKAPMSASEVKKLYSRAGWPGVLQEGLREVLEMSKTEPFSPFVIAGFYAKLGQKDEAIEWLEKAYEQRDFRLMLISVSFDFDAMRSDPRFIELVKRVGLPQ
jgi:serine/threonine-protein kinase